jgi:diacylglycerol kinase (ATP)
VFKKKEAVGFIINPISGAIKKKSLPAIIDKSLDTSRYKPVVAYSSCPGNATQVATDMLQKGISKIVAMGGDGTVNEVAKSLINSNATLGIVPLGSGNGLARHLKIPMDSSRAVSLINFGRIAMMDYGMVNGTPFFCTAGVGFDALIGNKFASIKGRGFFNYIRSTIGEYFTYEPQVYTLLLNGNAIAKEAFLITIANASQYGNNAYIAPSADIADGLLDVTIISPFPKYLAPDIGIRLFNRRIGKSRFVETFRITEMEIIRQQPDFIHFDGEPATLEANLKFYVKPLGLNVFVP